MHDLKELDRYPWTGHSAILGRRKNPLLLEVTNRKSGVRNQRTSNQKQKDLCPVKFLAIKSEAHLTGAVNPACPACPVASENGTGVAPADGTGVKNKSLAEKTIEDVLLHFDNTKKVARRKYRQFVKNGIDQGRRPELQGGGLVRSAGGNKANLLGRKKEEREKGDPRVLGSGDFVSRMLHESNKEFEKRTLNRPTLKAITEEVITGFSISPIALFSGSRNGQVSKARAVISYLAVKKAGYTQKEVGDSLNVSRIAVKNSLQRAEKNLDMCQQIWDIMT